MPDACTKGCTKLARALKERKTGARYARKTASKKINKKKAVRLRKFPHLQGRSGSPPLPFLYTLSSPDQRRVDSLSLSDASAVRCHHCSRRRHSANLGEKFLGPTISQRKTRGGDTPSLRSYFSIPRFGRRTRPKYTQWVASDASGNGLLIEDAQSSSFHTLSVTGYDVGDIF